VPESETRWQLIDLAYLWFSSRMRISGGGNAAIETATI
jgi:hypothetical protein